MQINMLDTHGVYICDHVEGPLPENWTADLVGDGYYRAQYQGASVSAATGEWAGGTWQETGGPSAEAVEAERKLAVEAVETEYLSRFSYASNMIGALSDEIFSIDDAGDPVPDTLRVTLKSWRTYRVALTKVDRSAAKWPLSPEEQ